jgi:hypothetical protein
MTDFLLHMFHEAAKWDKGSTQSDKTRGRHTYGSAYGHIRKEIDGVVNAPISCHFMPSLTRSWIAW